MRCYGEFYRFCAKIPSLDIRNGRRTETYNLDAQKRDRARTAGARLPVLRTARRGQDHLRPHLRQGDKLPAPRRRRGLQRVRVVPQLRRQPLAEHTRARCRLEQLGRRHPQPHRAGAGHAAAGALLGVHHRRGAHALDTGVQRLSQNARRAAGTRRIHSGHHREAQDHPHDPLAMPDIRLQPHTRRGRRGVSAIHSLAGGGRGRRSGSEPHRAQGRRRYARRPVDVRQGRIVLRREARLQASSRHAQRAGLRHLLRHDRPAAGRQLHRGPAAFRRRARPRLLAADLHRRTQPAHARPAYGSRCGGLADRVYRHAHGAIPPAGGAVQRRFSVRCGIAADRSRRTHTAIVQPTFARRTGTHEDCGSRSKKKQ